MDEIVCISIWANALRKGMNLSFLNLSNILLWYVSIYQPLRTEKVWHKVIFNRSLTGLHSEFFFS